jgi:hypothetical protein
LRDLRLRLPIWWLRSSCASRCRSPKGACSCHSDSSPRPSVFQKPTPRSSTSAKHPTSRSTVAAVSSRRCSLISYPAFYRRTSGVQPTMRADRGRFSLSVLYLCIGSRRERYIYGYKKKALCISRRVPVYYPHPFGYWLMVSFAHLRLRNL